MNKNTAKARRVLRERTAANRLTSSLKRGRALKTHAIAVGIAGKVADGIADGLRSVAKRLGVKPVKVTRTHRSADRLRKAYHYTPEQVARLRVAYRPRKAEYREAIAAWALAA
jgi:hypothetical protein